MSDIELLERPAQAATPTPVRQRASRPMAATPVIPVLRLKLATIAGQAAAPRAMAPLAEEDALRPARGIVLGLVLVMPFWAAVGSTLWAVLG